MLARGLKYELCTHNAKIIESDLALQPINEFQLEHLLPQLFEQLKNEKNSEKIKIQFKDKENTWGFARDVLNLEDVDLIIDEKFPYHAMKLDFEI